ncbi:hypothetical protein GF343_01055 [Candidatus Woesearchaeota archaeon]|nr:hypothetical protein [Candidatus Woesearchaeota archaeon]
MKKQVPVAWIFGGLLFAILLTIFLVRKAAITGGFATGGTKALSVAPFSGSMLTIIAAAALILIVIFAGVGKIEH